MLRVRDGGRERRKEIGACRRHRLRVLVYFLGLIFVRFALEFKRGVRRGADNSGGAGARELLHRACVRDTPSIVLKKVSFC